MPKRLGTVVLRHKTLVRGREFTVVGLGKPAPHDALSDYVAAETGQDVNTTGQPRSMQATPRLESPVPTLELPLQVNREGASVGGTTVDCSSGVRRAQFQTCSATH